MTATPDWLERKACRPEHSALFFPSGAGGIGNGNDYAAALALCRSCEARQPCRAEAEAHGDIVDGHTTHGQVVGGCAPKPTGKRPPGKRYWTNLEPCGTVAAYKRHIRRREPVCAPCREAIRIANRRAAS